MPFGIQIIVLRIYAAVLVSEAEAVMHGRCAGEGTGGKAVLDLKGVWHPCVNPAVGCSVVPNDLQLGLRWVAFDLPC